MDIQKTYDPKSYWDEKAQRAGLDFESAVCFNDVIENKIIDRVQKRFIRMAFRQISQRIDLAGKKILDYGCGTGRWVQFFLSYGMEYIGIDLSTEMVKIATQRFPDTKFAALSKEGIKYPSQTFDIVCSIAVLHHNPYEEQSLIIHQLSRIIKLKGFLVLFESIGPRESKSAIEFPRPCEDWRKTLKDLGLEHLWSRQTRYFSTRTILNKLAGENRFHAISNKIAIYLDPYIGGFLPSRLQTRGAMIFQKHE